MAHFDRSTGQPHARRRQRTIRTDDFHRQMTDDARQVRKAYALADEKRHVRMPQTLRIYLSRSFDPGVVSRAQDLRVDGVSPSGATGMTDEQVRPRHFRPGSETPTQRLAQGDVTPPFIADANHAPIQIDVAPA